MTCQNINSFFILERKRKLQFLFGNFMSVIFLLWIQFSRNQINSLQDNKKRTLTSDKISKENKVAITLYLRVYIYVNCYFTAMTRKEKYACLQAFLGFY